jgi:hypothetical protein
MRHIHCIVFCLHIFTSVVRLLSHCNRCLNSAYADSSKSIPTTAVILTIINLLQWWTNQVRSNTLVIRCTYSSGFSIVQNTCESQFLISTKVAASYFALQFPHRQIFSLSGRFLFRKVKKVTRCKIGRIWRLLRVLDFVLAKKCCTSWDEWAGALSWWTCRFFDGQLSGGLRGTASRRRRGTCK